jgi:hypothetical protein
LSDWFRVRRAEKEAEASSPANERRTGSPQRRGDAEKLDPAEPLLAGISKLVAVGDRRFRPKSPLSGPLGEVKAHFFWTDARGPVGLRTTLGKGVVVALADSYPLSNLGIGQSDNGLLLANIARDLSGRYEGQIAFDEYHLGFPQADWSSLAMVKLIWAGPWRWAIVQAILVGLLALCAGAVRFGSPRDIKLARRRQHREFAESAGRLLDESGGSAVAAETLYRHYRDRLCRAASLDPDADQRRLVAAVSSRWGAAVAEALAQAAATTTGPVGRQKLLTVFRKLHHLVEKLDHGT